MKQEKGHGTKLARRRILYVGYLNDGETSGYRRAALERLGQDVVSFNVQDYTAQSGKLFALTYRYPVGPLVARVNRELIKATEECMPDVVWFDRPTFFPPKTLKRVKGMGCTIVCYNQDNPFGPRNDGCWAQLYKGFRLFDLHCLFRTADIARYRAWDLSFIKVQLSFDPLIHFAPPENWSDADRDREIAFNGTPLEDRPQFLRTLAEQYRLPVSVAGPKWQKVWDAELNRKYVREGFLKSAAYREAIWKSKVNLAFVTHMNEEDVAHKSFEISACGGFLLAERSEGHLACFKEDEEAVFFSSVEECAEKAAYYLARPELRQQIAKRGYARAMSSGYDNETQLALVLQRLDEDAQSQAGKAS